jgi:hypothetical protein
MEIGYSLASEELEPTHKVQFARRGNAARGRDPERHLDVHQIGSNKDGFLRFSAEEVLPEV